MQSYLPLLISEKLAADNMKWGKFVDLVQTFQWIYVLGSSVFLWCQIQNKEP